MYVVYTLHLTLSQREVNVNEQQELVSWVLLTVWVIFLDCLVAERYERERYTIINTTFWFEQIYTLKIIHLRLKNESRVTSSVPFFGLVCSLSSLFSYGWWTDLFSFILWKTFFCSTVKNFEEKKKKDCWKLSDSGKWVWIFFLFLTFVPF